MAPIVLVVDDDSAVRELICAFVRGAGYDAIAAESAQEALEVASASFGPIDALVVDLVMPDSDGFDLAGAVKRYQPSAKVLYVSGWADMSWTGAFLAKPFSGAQLAEALHTLLHSGEDGNAVPAIVVAA